MLEEFQRCHREWGLMGGVEGAQRELELNPFAEVYDVHGKLIGDYYTPEQQVIFEESRDPASQRYSWPESARELVPSSTKLRSQGKLTNAEESRAPFLQVILPEDTIWERQPGSSPVTSKKELEAARHRLWEESIEKMQKAQDDLIKQDYIFERNDDPSWKLNPSDLKAYVGWAHQRDRHEKQPTRSSREYEREAVEYLRPVRFVLKEGAQKYIACQQVPARMIEIINHHIEWTQLAMQFDTAARAPDSWTTKQYIPYLQYKLYKKPVRELAQQDQKLRQMGSDEGYDVRKVPHRTSDNPLWLRMQSRRMGAITRESQDKHEKTIGGDRYRQVCAALRERITPQMMDGRLPEPGVEDDSVDYQPT